MKILVVADEESKYFYDYYTPGRLKDFELIIACGDLKKQYLEFLATMARCPLLYVPGNHDSSFVTDPPEGCICIDEKIYVHKGIRIAGLGGSMKYQESPYMYTEHQMLVRTLRLKLLALRHKGIDILVTHSPPKGVHDMDDLAHRGFASFLDLLDRFQPRYLFHGHVHRNYGRDLPKRSMYGSTEVINAYGYIVIDYPDSRDINQ